MPPLPGKKPDDPTLETAIRYLNRSERTEQEVKDKIEELRRYVRGDKGLKAELIEGLKLFMHLMRESQAGRIPIRYGTPETLSLIETFYRELSSAAVSRSGKPAALGSLTPPGTPRRCLDRLGAVHPLRLSAQNHPRRMPIDWFSYCEDSPIAARAKCQTKYF